MEHGKTLAIQLLQDARDLIADLGWSRKKYIERDRSGAPIAFDIMGALQYATVSGNYERSIYLRAKSALEEVCKPLSLTSFNRLANTSTAVIGRYDAAVERVKRDGVEHECKIIPFPGSRDRK